MWFNKKVIILGIVILAVGCIFAYPYLRKSPITKFAVTPQPAAKLEQAVQNHRPVFLEFYSPK